MKIRRRPSGIYLFERNTGLNTPSTRSHRHPTSGRLPHGTSQLLLPTRATWHARIAFHAKHTARLGSERLIAWMQELDGLGCLGVGLGAENRHYILS